MFVIPKELNDMYEKFEPYLVEQKDGTREFRSDTPEYIRKLRSEYLRRFRQLQMEECCW